MSDLPDEKAVRTLLDQESGNPWYHGSPLHLEILQTGSTITQDISLAKVFSHKPHIVSIDDNVLPIRIRHNGKLPGLLYRIDEPLSPGDLIPHPNSSMAPGLEWITQRPLRLVRIGSLEIDPEQVLSQEDILLLIGRL